MPRLPASLLVACSLAAALPAAAGVTVDLDTGSLNKILGATAAQRVQVPVTEGRTLEVELSNLKVTGLDPAGCDDGCILTELQLRVPQLDMTVPVKPRLSLHVAADEQLEVRFQDVRVPLPMMGGVNLAPLLAPLRFPVAGAFQVPGGRPDQMLRSKLTGVQLGAQQLRLTFELETLAPPKP